MIIDVHSHIIMGREMMTPGWEERWMKMAGARANRPPETFRGRLEEMLDPNGETMLRDMDEAKVHKTVLVALDVYSLTKGEMPKMSRDEQHQRLAQIVKSHPDRFIAFASVDPRIEGAPQLLENYVKEYDMKGLKLFPMGGFYPNERIVYPLYQKCMELDIPVMFHTGPSHSGYSKYTMPVNVDEVAADFPDLRLIMSHCGLIWWHDAVAIALNKPNVFVDLSAWEPRLRNPRELYTTFRLMLDWLGEGKVMWGSDWPMFRVFRRLVTYTGWVKAFTEPPEWVREAGITFSDSEITAFMGGNAARILGLES